MFLALGLLIFPSDVLDVVVEGTLLALVVAFVARPIATFVATAFEKFTLAERVILGWAGLRGAVPIVLALFPVNADITGSVDFLNEVFFAVLLSTLLQGSTFEPLARRLGLTTDEPALPSPIAETGTIRRLGAEVVEYPVHDDDAIVGLRTRELELPREALVSVIVRERRGAPAARLDPHRGRRPAARARPPGGRARGARSARALAARPDRAGVGAAAAAARGLHARIPRAPVDRRRRRREPARARSTASR